MEDTREDGDAAPLLAPLVGDADDDSEEDVLVRGRRRPQVDAGADVGEGEGEAEAEDGADEAAEQPARQRRLRKAAAAAETAEGEEEEGGDFTHRGDEDGDEGDGDEEEYVEKAKPKKPRKSKKAADGDDADADADADAGGGKKKRRRKKDKGAEEGADGEPASRKKKRAAKGADADAAKGRRPKRAAAAAAEAGNFGGMGEGGAGGEGEGEEGDAARAARAAYAADEADDDDDDAHPAPQAVESGSKSDFDAMLERLKKKKKVERAQEELVAEVVAFLTQMDDCAASDFEAHREGMPAVRKVGMLVAMEARFHKEFLHDLLLDRGALHSLAKWLAPLADGTLPNESVRAAVLRSLATFDCDDDFKERLRSSGVGKYVMLLSKHSDESAANKKRCLGLIEKWMRPVYKKTSEYSQQAVRVARARDPAARARASQPLPSAAGAGGSGDILETAVALKPGDAGFRYHASIPQALAMDFKVMPQSSAVPLASKKYDKESAKGKLTSKFLNLKRKSGKKTQAEQLSIEGRKL